MSPASTPTPSFSPSAQCRNQPADAAACHTPAGVLTTLQPRTYFSHNGQFVTASIFPWRTRWEMSPANFTWSFQIALPTVAGTNIFLSRHQRPGPDFHDGGRLHFPTRFISGFDRGRGAGEYQSQHRLHRHRSFLTNYPASHSVTVLTRPTTPGRNAPVLAVFPPRISRKLGSSGNAPLSPSASKALQGCRRVQRQSLASSKPSISKAQFTRIETANLIELLRQPGDARFDSALRQLQRIQAPPVFGHAQRQRGFHADAHVHATGSIDWR